MDCAFQILVWATVLGLGLDIFGFILVIRYGHSLFIRTAPTPPPPGWPEGKDGDIYIQYDGPPDKGGDSRRRFRAKLGVALVVVGFTFQIVGAIAAIQSSN